MIAIAGGLILLASRPATTAGQCHRGGCDQSASAVPSRVAPAAGPSSPAPAPRPSEITTRQVTITVTTPASTVITATASPSVRGTATGPAPSPTATTPGLAPGSQVSIQATTSCCTSFYIRHDDQDNEVVITQITSASPAIAKADASWIVRAGLAGSSCVSFESANQPGQYLRHYDFELYLGPDDGSSQFADDATFCPQPGNSGQGYSFQSVNYPHKYIRHYDYVAYIASDGGSNPWDTPALWPSDTTWLLDEPWGVSTPPGSPGFPGCGQQRCHHP
jgi:hypothetical protein